MTYYPAMRTLLPAILVATLAAACGAEEPESRDADLDGVPSDRDCDDHHGDVHPGAVEFCDGLDNDCDGTVDEPDALGAPAWYADSDGDGFGDPNQVEVACDAPDGTVENKGDCDDQDDTRHPLAPERCDAVDNDCDGQTDNHPPDRWAPDEDGDGYGAAGGFIFTCDSEGMSPNALDCDDDDGAVSPDAAETCNGYDDDCDGLIDDLDDAVPAGQLTWFADRDGDGFGGDSSVVACDPPEPQGWVTTGGDCDDWTPHTHPAVQREFCDGIDAACDGPEPADAWAYAKYPYRIQVVLEVMEPVAAPPVFLVPFDPVALAAELGEPVVGDGVAVLVDDCGGPLQGVELPSQWVDHPAVGGSMLAVRWDTDGDAMTVEPLGVGESPQLSVYFGGPLPGEPAPTDLEASTTRLTSLGSTFHIESGRIADVEHAGVWGLGGQLAAEGNGVSTESGWLSAGDFEGTSELLADGPVLAILQTETVLEDAHATVTYASTLLLWSGRAELTVATEMVASAGSTIRGQHDRAEAIRPLSITAPAASTATAPDLMSCDQSGDKAGLAWTWVRPPAFLHETHCTPAGSWAAGNDLWEAGGPAEQPFDLDTVLVLDARAVLLPHAGGWASAEPILATVLTTPSLLLTEPERR
jgi:hypothetical protein